MTSRLTIRGWSYLLLAVTGLFLAVAIGEAAPALFALPAGVAVAYGAAADGGARPRLDLVLERRRTMEGVEVKASLRIDGSGRQCRVLVDLPEGLAIAEVDGAERVGGAGLVVPMWSGLGEVAMTLVADRWGTYSVGVTVAVDGPFRIRSSQVESISAGSLVVLPEPKAVETLVEPLHTNLHSGDVVSAGFGPGLELAQLRPWAQSDPVRSINWRASARAGRPWVTDHHVERNGDLILLVDSLAHHGGASRHAITRAVRIAASLVEAYGGARHRLGLVSLSGLVRWFGLGGGRRHEYRLLEALMATQAVARPVWSAVDRVLQRVVRPPSMVVAVSPLLDDRLVGRIHTLAAARTDIVTIAVDPGAWLGAPLNEVQGLARRMFALEREAMIDRLRASGVAVGRWRPDRELTEVMEEVEEWRRLTRRARL